MALKSLKTVEKSRYVCDFFGFVKFFGKKYLVLNRYFEK